MQKSPAPLPAEGAAPERHFIFGYGSLINSLSRSVTGETGSAVAVKISGFERHWSCISTDYGMSSVVVIAAKKAACNGVIVEVNPDQLANFDLRERGYQRVLVDVAQIDFYLTDSPLPAPIEGPVKIWLYQAHKVILPCENHPVVLSYLDVILAGCLEYSSEFCEDFVALTQGWQHAMLNDRQAPRYPRVQVDVNTDLLNSYIQLSGALSDEKINLGYARS